MEIYWLRSYCTGDWRYVWVVNDSGNNNTGYNHYENAYHLAPCIRLG